MRRNSTIDPRQNKRLARQKYSERQLDKWVRWKMEVHGSIRYKDLIEQIKKYNL